MSATDFLLRWRSRQCDTKLAERAAAVFVAVCVIVAVMVLL